MSKPSKIHTKRRKPPKDFPFRWVIETRRASADDAARFPGSVYYGFGEWHQGGRSTYLTEELLIVDTVDQRLLPERLRALADHYERVQPVRGDDAVIIIGRRRGDPEEDDP